MFEKTIVQIYLMHHEEANMQTLDDVFEQHYPPEFDGRRWFIRRGGMRVHVYMYEENVLRVGRIHQGIFSKFCVLYSETY